MKAAVVLAMSSSWQIKDVPQPQPGPGQVKMRASGICYTDEHETLGHIQDHFHESSDTSRSARSLPWRPTSPRGRWATAWVQPGFNPLAGGANGASAAAECSVPI